MLKKIISSILTVSVICSATVSAMTGAIYEVKTGMEILKSINTSSTTGWDTTGSCALRSQNDSLMVMAPQNAEYSADMLAGGELFDGTAPKSLMCWDFETADKDSFYQKDKAALLAEPSLVPAEKWSGMYTVKSYWTSPVITNVTAVQYMNETTGDEFEGEKTPAAAGSTNCIKTGLGGNDYHYQSLGIKIKLPEEKIKAGETYILNYYTMGNTADRELYAGFTKPSQEEPDTMGAEDNGWHKDSASIGKIKRYWTSGKARVTPTEEDFEGGYTTLWLGTRGTTLTRNENLYFDNITLIAESDLSVKEAVFTAKVKGAGQEINVTGDMQGTEVFNESITAGDEWATVEGKLIIDTSADFYMSEDRGSDSNTDAFKISFASTERGIFYIKDISINCPVEPDYYAKLNGVTGRVTVSMSVYCAEAGEAEAVLSVVNSDAEEVLEEKPITLTAGLNEIMVSGVLLGNASTDSILAVYIRDENRKVLSERKQSVAELFVNGVNLVSGENYVYDALKLFGSGEYLVEFTVDSSIEEAVVSIGALSGKAAVSNGIGVCEITVTEDDIKDMTETTAVSIDEETAQNITLKKVMD